MNSSDLSAGKLITAITGLQVLLVLVLAVGGPVQPEKIGGCFVWFRRRLTGTVYPGPKTYALAEKITVVPLSGIESWRSMIAVPETAS